MARDHVIAPKGVPADNKFGNEPESEKHKKYLQLKLNDAQDRRKKLKQKLSERTAELDLQIGEVEDEIENLQSELDAKGQ